MGLLDALLVPLDDVAKSMHYSGVQYHETTDAMPFLRHVTFEWEKRVDILLIAAFSREHWEVPLVACVLYVALITLGPRYMRDRKAYDWRPALAAWNLFLSAFSFIGMCRTVPHLLYNLSTHAFEDTVCEPASEMFGVGSSGLWTGLFIFSKIPELVDTVFIVFRKKKLIFLHWYHHLTVLLYCWLAYATEASTGLYFVSMNYTVHAVMYGYYFLVAVKQLPQWFPAHVITVAQISQMVIGIGICVSSYLYKQHRPCGVTDDCMLAGALMYASYCALFVHFALKRFVFTGKAAKKAKTL